MESDILPINFTISDAAKAEIENLRKIWNAELSDPAAIPVIAWGIYMPYHAPQFEEVIVTFYGESELPPAEMIQEASGLKIVFFITEKYHHHFEGKVLDHSPERGFFLSD